MEEVDNVVEIVIKFFIDNIIEIPRMTIQKEAYKAEYKWFDLDTRMGYDLPALRDEILRVSIGAGEKSTEILQVIQGRKFDAPVNQIVNALIDYDEIRDLARKNQPKLIIAGASAYPRAIDFKIFADIAHEVGAVLMVDMAHIAGLVAGGAHQSPVPYADIVTTTTHKTLRGPRGGLILAKEEFAKKLNSAVFPGTQGGPLEHVIAAKAVCLKEAMEPSFKTYARNVVENAKVMADALLEEGFDLVTGGTDNHLMLADLRPMHITGKELQARLDENHITLNKNAIPGDPEKPSITSGVRIGTAAVTTRGLGTEEMKQIAHCIALTAKDFAGTSAAVKQTVAEICEKYPLYR